MSQSQSISVILKLNCEAIQDACHLRQMSSFAADILFIIHCARWSWVESSQRQQLSQIYLKFQWKKITANNSNSSGSKDMQFKISTKTATEFHDLILTFTTCHHVDVPFNRKIFLCPSNTFFTFIYSLLLLFVDGINF